MKSVCGQARISEEEMIQGWHFLPHVLPNATISELACILYPSFQRLCTVISHSVSVAHKEYFQKHLRNKYFILRTLL